MQNEVFLLIVNGYLFNMYMRMPMSSKQRQKKEQDQSVATKIILDSIAGEG